MKRSADEQTKGLSFHLCTNPRLPCLYSRLPVTEKLKNGILYPPCCSFILCFSVSQGNGPKGLLVIRLLHLLLGLCLCVYELPATELPRILVFVFRPPFLRHVGVGRFPLADCEPSFQFGEGGPLLGDQVPRLTHHFVDLRRAAFGRFHLVAAADVLDHVR